MKKYLPIGWLAISIAALSVLQAHAQESETSRFSPIGRDWAIGAKINTLGPGAELVKKISKSFDIRIGGSLLNYSLSKTYEDFYTDLKLETDLKAVNLTFDWYPIHKSLFKTIHFNGGVLYNLSEMEFSGRPSSNVKVGSQTFSPEEIGQVNIKLAPEKINYYVGFGLGRTVPRKFISFNLEFGLIYIGTPKATMTATGMVAPTAEQEALINQNIKDDNFWPVVSFAMFFRIH